MPCQLETYRRAAGLSPEQCDQSAWALLPSGERVAGAEAFAVAFDALLGVSLFRSLYRTPLLRSLGDGLYRWVAAHRSRFPGVTPALQRMVWEPQRGRKIAFDRPDTRD